MRRMYIIIIPSIYHAERAQRRSAVRLLRVTAQMHAATGARLAQRATESEI